MRSTGRTASDAIRTTWLWHPLPRPHNLAPNWSGGTGGGLLKLEPSDALRLQLPFPQKKSDVRGAFRRAHSALRAGNPDSARAIADAAMSPDVGAQAIEQLWSSVQLLRRRRLKNQSQTSQSNLATREMGSTTVSHTTADFPESVKEKVRRLAAPRCCYCQEVDYAIHHLLPKQQGGLGPPDNAIPLCVQVPSLLRPPARQEKATTPPGKKLPLTGNPAILRRSDGRRIVTSIPLGSSYLPARCPRSRWKTLTPCNWPLAHPRATKPGPGPIWTRRPAPPQAMRVDCTQYPRGFDSVAALSR